METKQIKRALISVFHKDGLDKIVKLLGSNGVEFLSTGGTRQFIESLGYSCDAVEDLTGYPSILGGRVKTLHPKVFGGILNRRDNEDDRSQISKYDIPEIDLVIVDLYPFEETVASGACEADIIEKIDIGGISLIRAAAKNYKDVVIVASKAQYQPLTEILERGIETTLAERKMFARDAFAVSSGYDSAIFSYFDKEDTTALRVAAAPANHLRYGENPHQKGLFFGNLNDMMQQLHGKEISYNNILDIDAAVALINDFEDTTIAILKHNNACGIASNDNLTIAWTEALACDPVSAFGGVIITNKAVDEATAVEMDKIFFEVVIAPDYSEEALQILKKKKNRIILKANSYELPKLRIRSALNGFLCEESDVNVELPADFKIVTKVAPSEAMQKDLKMANILVKHYKSNAIVLLKDGKLLGAGMGQVSRIDSLRHAIERAKAAGRDLNGAVMASDAFFPFADCVEEAYNAGIRGVIHPGGSIRDGESVEFCDKHEMAMVMTGIRHFKH
jgi:phosphoribosylaminoimidazolecarboxamide formyltransferase/IMP cyclohydrolase